MNCFTNGQLSGTYTAGCLNPFAFDEGTHQYNQEQMQRDIGEYVLSTYEGLSIFGALEMYAKYPCAYLKVSIRKRILAYDELA